MSTTTIDINKEFSEIETMYSDTVGEKDTFGCLAMGEFGSGKTRFVTTAPMPAIVYMFDPKGAAVLRKYRQEKRILVVPLWNDNSQKPFIWKKFKAMIDRHVEEGFLRNFATVSIDSFTYLSEAVTHEVAAHIGPEADVKVRKDRPRNNPFEGDYRIIYQEVIDTIKKISGEPVNLILTAHLDTIENAISGEITKDIKAYKGLRALLPPMFTEKYVFRERRKGSDTEYYIMTQPRGMYRASTQLGGDGVFEAEEVPDLKALMSKVDLDTSDIGDGRYRSGE